MSFHDDNSKCLFHFLVGGLSWQAFRYGPIANAQTRPTTAPVEWINCRKEYKN
jgi:hypothetical protein